MFDVLVFLYENCGALEACGDEAALSQQLAAAGFPDRDISAAIGWLRDLVRTVRGVDTQASPTPGSVRVFSTYELARLGTEAAGFIAFLDGAGQITAAQREIVIERALAVEDFPLALPALKVIVLMVLWSQRTDIDVLLLEELLDDGAERLLH
jgi:Smg protein